jgi:hypothetical protein
MMLVMDQYSPERRPSIWNQQKGRDHFSFITGVTDPLPVITIFFCLLVNLKGNRGVGDADVEKLTDLAPQLVDGWMIWHLTILMKIRTQVKLLIFS